ncbi:MAG: hypothetical protein ABIE23_05085, partial [archaeon]
IYPLIVSNKNKVSIDFFHLIRQGRAKNLPKTKFHFSSVYNQKCRGIRGVHLSTSGDAYICCNSPIAPTTNNSVFKLGNVKRDSLSIIFDNYKKSKLIRFLSDYGPYSLVEGMHKKKKKSFCKNKSYSQICDYCIEKLGKHEKRGVDKFLTKFYSD